MRLALLTLLSAYLSSTLLAQRASTDVSDWFVWNPTNTSEAGVIGMADWLDKPAGKHGVLKIVNSDFQFENGQPLKIWGTNHSNRGCGPTREEADRRAAWYAKMGVNAIRMHKFTYASRGGFGHPENSTILTEEGWERLDYYWNKLREQGIYLAWSPVFRHYLVDKDSTKVLAYDEIKEGLDRNIIYLVNFAPDLQKIMFSLASHLLNHVNPHTGRKYADEPALISYELQNEDNLFWLNPKDLEKVPTYKKMFCQQFADWLKKKYGSQQAMLASWGPNALNMFPEHMTNERLEDGNIYPIAWFPYFSPEAIDNSASPQRLLDNAAFLYETQLKYYQEFEKVIRETGYQGPLVGSCWQAGQGVIHYYNLHSDYKMGIIDRHNYFGARPHSLEKGVFNNNSMFDFAGSGLLSSGLHAVKGAPFVLSEWTGKLPNEWIAEGPAIIGIYGMGFQGWDGSYHFNGGNAGFSDGIAVPNVYNTNNVIQIGQFPALSRMIQRNDIRVGELLPNRKVHIPSLASGKIGFKERLRQNGDIKQLGGDVPIEALALGRLELEFTDVFTPTILPEWDAWVGDSIIVSNTKELVWNYQGENGFISVNTDKTKAIAGFTSGKVFELGDLTISTSNPYAIIYLTCLDREQQECNSFLLTTIARARNTSMKYVYEKEVSLADPGAPPVLVEPVDVSITFKNSDGIHINVLDHDGLRTENSFTFNHNELKLSGREHQTIWYEIIIDN